MQLTLNPTGALVGIEMTPRSVKWTEGHERKLVELRDALSPFCNSRSATLRVLIDVMHLIVFTPGVLEQVEGLLQGIQCARFVLRTQQKPGPMRADPEDQTTFNFKAMAIADPSVAVFFALLPLVLVVGRYLCFVLLALSILWLASVRQFFQRRVPCTNTPNIQW